MRGHVGPKQTRVDRRPRLCLLGSVWIKVWARALSTLRKKHSRDRKVLIWNGPMQWLRRGQGGRA